MQDAMFVLKCFVVTGVLIVLMQIRVDGHTVEGHMMSWVHHSSVSHTLQDVAEGAVKAGVDGKRAIANLVGSHEVEAPSATEASTSGWFKIKRSAAYYRQKDHEQERAIEKLEKEKAARVNEDLSDDESEARK